MEWLARLRAILFFTTMKKFIALAAVTLSAAFQIQAQTTWELMWSDEFSGSSLNTGNWSYEFGNGGWGNNEWQYYTNAAENLEVSDGLLKITARHEGTGATEYTSARIITKGLVEFEYGKVEARMKLPLGQGLWPAFWTLGANIDDVSWPECGEIDIMEHVSNEYMTHGAVHWENNGHAYTGNGVNTDPTQFHVYGIVWEENLIRWYLDGVQFYQFTIQASNNTDDAFRHPMFLLLNLAIGGNWPGYPDATTPFPSSMFVDYVRVYQPAAPSSVESSNGPIITLYPNPAHDELILQGLFDGGECSILAANGQCLKRMQINGTKTSIDISELAVGNYTFEYHAGEQRFTQSFVKQ
jgi:beta-glucanase (GH16 family)